MRSFLFLILILVLSACSTVERDFSNRYVAGHRVSKPISCVPYARDVSGVQIRGDAYTWWQQAQGRYARGNVPKVGAIYVLAKTSKLKHGHLAVVTQVLDNRHIEVTHSNWGSDKATRSLIYKRMRVEDISSDNSWTNARFWNKDINTFGLPYTAYGFIYP
jgi:surface antigen